MRQIPDASVGLLTEALAHVEAEIVCHPTSRLCAASLKLKKVIADAETNGEATLGPVKTVAAYGR